MVVHVARRHLPLICIVVLVCGPACTSVAQPKKPIYAHKPLPRKEKVSRLVIRKGKKTMAAWSGKRLLKVYKVAYGKGDGPKRMEGDNRTPEGTYHIAGRHRSKTFYKFMLLSYPNARDRRRFARLKRQKKIPKTARIGSAVGIHGEKKGATWLPHKLLNWTRGCIAVDNDEIDELYRAVKPKAKVEIHP